MKTLLLDVDAWDLVIDSAGNVAVASNPYSLAQDAASSIRLFKGELYYNTVRGVPYWGQILGQTPPLSYMKAKFVEAAMGSSILSDGSNEIVAAQAFITSFVDRQIKGQVQVTDINGVIVAAAF